MKRLTWLVIPTLALSLMAPYATAADAPGSAYRPKSFVSASQVERPLAQGLVLTSFERLYPSGWVNGWLLSVDLAHPMITTDLVTAPGVTKGESISSMAARAGAIAAINGDFFDVGQTGIALGSVVRSGEFLQSRIPDWPNAAGVSKDRIGKLVNVALEGTVTLPSGNLPLGAINLPTVPSHSIGLFTPMWTLTRDRSTYGAAEATEVIVKAGKVISVSPTATPQPIPADGYVLVGREEWAKPLATLKVGDSVSLSYRPKPDLRWAIGGRSYLVQNGQIAQNLNDTAAGPRTALGFSADGRKLFLLAVDGRSAASGGLTLRGVAELMQGFGATDVLELDGGGSTTMVARLPGDETVSIINTPSDGRERLVPNGVGVFATPGSGVAATLSVQATSQRVFPGLSRRLSVEGLDEQYGPAPVGAVTWRVQGGGEISQAGLFRAGMKGLVTVLAEASGGVKGQLPLQVVGPLARIEMAGEGLRLSPGKAGTFSIRGYDADGYMAPIEPADLSFTYDTNLFKVELMNQAVQVTPLKEGSGVIRVSVQGKETWVPVAAAPGNTVLNTFDQAANWTLERFPATVTASLATAPGRSGNGLKLTYNFTGTGTRAAYAQTNPTLQLPGQPEAMGLWVKGDGKGAWLRAVVTDARGTNHTLNLARNVDWTDWRYVEVAIPAAAVQPVRLHRIYPVETDAARQYAGELIFDDLTVRTAVSTTLPEVPKAPTPAVDPILAPPTVASQQAWTFAFVGSLGLPVGQLGNTNTILSAAEEIARKAISQAVANKVAFFVIDPAVTPVADEALLRQAAGQTPIYRLARSSRQVDVNGVRFVFLGSQGGSLRATQFDQLPGLKAMLDQAETDADIRQVVLLSQLTPAQFADKREGEMVTRWLSEFEERSGKSAAYLATKGSTLASQRVEGIPFIEVGRPKAPLLFAIDPAQGADWLRLSK